MRSCGVRRHRRWVLGYFVTVSMAESCRDDATACTRRSRPFSMKMALGVTLRSSCSAIWVSRSTKARSPSSRNSYRNAAASWSSPVTGSATIHGPGGTVPSSSWAMARQVVHRLDRNSTIASPASSKRRRQADAARQRVPLRTQVKRCRAVHHPQLSPDLLDLVEQFGQRPEQDAQADGEQAHEHQHDCVMREASLRERGG